MPIHKTSENTLKARTEIARRNIENEMRLNDEAFLKRWFNLSGVDSTALAVIEIAEDEGYHDLANDFKISLSLQTGRVVA